MSSHISQNQARANRKELLHLRSVLESQRRGWVRDWPCSTTIGRVAVDAVTAAKVQTARTLKHAVIVTTDGDNLVLWATEAGK